MSDYVTHLMDALGQADVDVVGVPVRPAAHRRWFAATAAAADRVRQLRPDVVHVQFAPSAFRFSGMPGLLPRLLPARLPLVTTIHEYGWWAAPDWLPTSVWRPIEAARIWDRETGRLVLDSAAVIVTNPGHAMLLRRRTGRRPRQISLAPNVEVRRPTIRTRSQVRRRLGLAPHAFLLVFFGFVHPVKGIRYVLEALPTLLAERPDLHLTVVGGFTSQALPEPEAAAFRSELETMAGGLGVRGAVTFTGHLPSAEVSEILHTADAAVLPFTAGVTLKSGALLATMTHGLPTAVTVPDIPDERLRDGENVAVIQRRRDAAAVARTLRRLIGDAALRERLTAGGLALTARHSWPAVAGTHRALYNDVLAHA